MWKYRGILAPWGVISFISEYSLLYGIVMIKSNPALVVRQRRRISKTMGPFTRTMGRRADVVWRDLIITIERGRWFSDPHYNGRTVMSNK